MWGPSWFVHTCTGSRSTAGLPHTVISAARSDNFHVCVCVVSLTTYLPTQHEGESVPNEARGNVTHGADIPFHCDLVAVATDRRARTASGHGRRSHRSRSKGDGVGDIVAHFVPVPGGAVRK